MGQYHLTVNLDKKEFIHPHKLGDGLKLWEQAASGPGGVGTALVMLLAVSNGRGGGDLDDPDRIVGRWGGDRIAIIGDYAEPSDLPGEFYAEYIYDSCRDKEDQEEKNESSVAGEYVDITEKVRQCIADNLSMYYSGSGWLDRSDVMATDYKVPAGIEIYVYPQHD